MLLTKLEIYIFVVLLFLFISCENNNSVEIPENNINIEKIAQSESFDSFKANADNFNEPFIKKINDFGDSEGDRLKKLIKDISNKERDDIKEAEYKDLVLEMGYEGIKGYEQRNMQYMQSLQSLIDEFPQIQELSEEKRKQVFIELFKSDMVSKSKSLGQNKSSNCMYDYRYCMEMAKGNI